MGRSLPWLHPPLRSRSLLLPRGNTPSGSVAPSCLPFPPSNRCGSPSKNTMSAAHPLSTGSASKFTTLLIYCCNCWHFNCLIDLLDDEERLRFSSSSLNPVFVIVVVVIVSLFNFY